MIDSESQTTGLPLLRTWPRVYTAVTIIFIAYVALLLVLKRAYS